MDEGFYQRPRGAATNTASRGRDARSTPRRRRESRPRRLALSRGGRPADRGGALHVPQLTVDATGGRQRRLQQREQDSRVCDEVPRIALASDIEATRRGAAATGIAGEVPRGRRAGCVAVVVPEPREQRGDAELAGPVVRLVRAAGGRDARAVLVEEDAARSCRRRRSAPSTVGRSPIAPATRRRRRSARSSGRRRSRRRARRARRSPDAIPTRRARRPRSDARARVGPRRRTAAPSPPAAPARERRRASRPRVARRRRGRPCRAAARRRAASASLASSRRRSGSQGPRRSARGASMPAARGAATLRPGAGRAAGTRARAARRRGSVRRRSRPRARAGGGCRRA